MPDLAALRPFQSFSQQMQIAVVEPERFQRMDGREHIFAVRAGLAVELAHEMELRREVEPPGILPVLAVDYVTQREDAPLRFGQQSHRTQGPLVACSRPGIYPTVAGHPGRLLPLRRDLKRRDSRTYTFALAPQSDAIHTPSCSTFIISYGAA